MASRLQFSLGALFAITTVFASALGFSRLIGPSNVGMLAGFVFSIYLIVRLSAKGLLLGVIFMWGSVFLGSYVEHACGFEKPGEALTNAVFLGIWSALGWLFAAIYLLPIYLLRLALGYWRSRTPKSQRTKKMSRKHADIG